MTACMSFKVCLLIGLPVNPKLATKILSTQGTVFIFSMQELGRDLSGKISINQQVTLTPLAFWSLLVSFFVFASRSDTISVLQNMKMSKFNWTSGYSSPTFYLCLTLHAKGDNWCSHLI